MTVYKHAEVSKEPPSYSSTDSAPYDGVEIGRKLGSAIKLLAIFCIAYFVAAMIATPELRHVAQIEILGLPVGFYTGILVFVVGVVVTRMCLNQHEKS